MDKLLPECVKFLMLLSKTMSETWCNLREFINKGDGEVSSGKVSLLDILYFLLTMV